MEICENPFIMEICEMKKSIWNYFSLVFKEIYLHYRLLIKTWVFDGIFHAFHDRKFPQNKK